MSLSSVNDAIPTLTEDDFGTDIVGEHSNYQDCGSDEEEQLQEDEYESDGLSPPKIDAPTEEQMQAEVGKLNEAIRQANLMAPVYLQHRMEQETAPVPTVTETPLPEVTQTVETGQKSGTNPLQIAKTMDTLSSKINLPGLRERSYEETMIMEWGRSTNQGLTRQETLALVQAVRENRIVDLNILPWILLGWRLRGESQLDEVRNVVNAMQSNVHNFVHSNEKFRKESEDLLARMEAKALHVKAAAPVVKQPAEIPATHRPTPIVPNVVLPAPEAAPKAAFYAALEAPSSSRTKGVSVPTPKAVIAPKAPRVRGVDLGATLKKGREKIGDAHVEDGVKEKTPKATKQIIYAPPETIDEKILESFLRQIEKGIAQLERLYHGDVAAAVWDYLVKNQMNYHGVTVADKHKAAQELRDYLKAL
ncbi:46K protein [morning glory varicosavirus]|uniref:46K protein n=1 Tax=morning glory varicosavirus TaxID=2946038 RepID=UPI002483E7BA|nr:46K protein [morning glory varicosavirus]UQZ09618.1 46K protein [morning glory varicosavirus]